MSLKGTKGQGAAVSFGIYSFILPESHSLYLPVLHGLDLMLPGTTAADLPVPLRMGLFSVPGMSLMSPLG